MKSATLVHILACLCLVQSLYYVPLLPDPLASHFTGDGVPNGWSSPLGFAAVYLAVVALHWLLFAWLPRFLPRLPERRINLPNKDYWLAPARRAKTLARLGELLGWFGVASLLLALVVVQMVVLANLDPPPRLSPGILWVLVAYFVFVAVWLLRVVLSFRRPAGR